MRIEFWLIIYFAAILGPVVITLVYCSIRDCKGTREESSNDDRVGELDDDLDLKQYPEQDIWQPDPRD